MRKLLFILLTLIPLSLMGATGDVTGFDIQPDGWSSRIYIDGANTNATLDFGWVSNNVPGISNKIMIRFTSPGFTSTGASNNVKRIIWGGYTVRMPYPYETNNDTILYNGVTNAYKISNTEWICANDYGFTLTARAGITTNSVAAEFAPTNSSTMPYPEPVANWTRVPWQHITNTTWRFGVRAGHCFYDNAGNDIAGVQIICMDTSTGNKITNNATPMVDWGYNTNAPFWNVYGSNLNVSPYEWVADVDLSSFTDNTPIRTDMIVWPTVGTNYLTTLNDRWTGMTSATTSITNFYDPDDDYGTFIGVVDPISGNDANGRVTNTTYGNVNTAHYFQHPYVAWNAIAASNNAFLSHNTPEGTVYYVTTNGTDFSWSGGTLSAGATAVASYFCNNVTFPGQPQAVITNRSNDRNVGHRLQFTNIKITIADPAVPFNATGALWFHQCNLNSPGATQPIQTTTNVFLTQCQVTNWAGGLKAVTTQNSQFRLVRGCDLTGFNHQAYPCVFMGNVHANTNGGAYSVYNDGNGSAYSLDMMPNGQIITENYFGGFKGGATCFEAGSGIAITNGILIENNVFEYCTNNQTPNLVFVGANVALNTTNAIFRGNGIYGKRSGFFYNDTGTSGAYKIFCSLRDNDISIPGFKDDLFGTKNANRTNNWSLMWGVACSGNFYAQSDVDLGVASFYQYFEGVNYMNTNAATALSWAAYSNPQCYDGLVNSWPGGGSYFTLPYSPAVRTGIEQTRIRFNILGQPRTRMDSPGPYSGYSPRRGDMM